MFETQSQLLAHVFTVLVSPSIGSIELKINNNVLFQLKTYIF